jgi:hypothetical protein
MMPPEGVIQVPIKEELNRAPMIVYFVMLVRPQLSSEATMLEVVVTMLGLLVDHLPLRLMEVLLGVFSIDLGHLSNRSFTLLWLK